jgi:hypothetical protein
MRQMRDDPFENTISVVGAVRSSSIYGADYLTELRRVLLRYVKPVTRAYLEWGMGNTTLAILQMRHTLPVDDFFSIDDNQAYVDELVAQFPAWSGFHPVCCDLTGPMKNDRDPEPNYATWPFGLERTFDFIFIDGRRRMECALAASLLCHTDTIVVLHDYRRLRYQPVKVLYDLVEDGTQFRVMRPKHGRAAMKRPTLTTIARAMRRAFRT